MASFTREIPERGRAGRPCFTSNKTADRLRECEMRCSTPSKIKPYRRSIFKEEGLDDLHRSVHPSHSNNATNNSSTSTFTITRPGTPTTFDEILGNDEEKENSESRARRENPWFFSKLTKGQRPLIKSSATAPPGSFSSVSRITLIAFLIAVILPGFRYGSDVIGGADAGLIPEGILVDNGSTIEGRADSPTDVCTRWAHQAANVNGTLYIYGGNAKSSSSQTTNTWNNNFLSLDLTKSWKAASPALTGLPQPSGPPAVALGALWNSYNSLFVYGGMFSDSPMVDPLPVSTWEYNIKSSNWIEHSSPQTSPGNYSDGGDQPVQRAAEGAGLSVPELGRSWYFGGHQDSHTTQGWTTEVWRIYLKSFLEFTHPGYANTGVTSLGSSKAAGSDGVYRNITEGGIQADDGFTERADGVLVYVPGWGDEGIILGLAGGTNTTFTEMNIIDIYDVANSTWYKQSTSGSSPPIRVDPCAAVAAAPDGTSFNVYLYGGQNLLPADNQTQFSDMWILTIPSFTWVQVNMDGQSQPPARAGHTCTMRDGQIVVVGGYVGAEISCDSPGIFVFNASSLQWSNGFTALASSGSESENQQAQDSSVLQGSVGYQVPGLVQSIIGGSSQGGATATSPAAGSATAGPIATGKPPSFTVTKSGSTVVQTSNPTGASASGGAGQSSKKSGPNVGAIAAGTIAAALAVLAGYLAFCTWLYRRQLNLYKNHVAMAQRTAFNNSPENASWTGRSSEKGAGAGAALGPFGTSVGGSGSTGRPSNVESSGSGTTYPTPYSGATGTTMSSIPMPEDSHAGGYGGGSMPGSGAAVKGYGWLSEESSEYTGAGAGLGRTSGSRRSANSAHSSAADLLLSGHEPSFFAVVMNPRRTLRVVNSD
ncbi:Kelch repeat-containing protein [Lachnellula occidentalis]|uniref:Kelch repeat-containing protein n=1 Tax=Lachnellula occidentalis TaxID=215460 RepID=A0A8H8S9N4_9HELO|nr:Kelch repeat-containing protein [Lachnellula occidentalis]